MSLTVQQRKEVAIRFVEKVMKGTADKSAMSPNFSAWTTSLGAVDKEEYERRVNGLGHIFVEGMKGDVENITCEDNRVAIQVHGYGLLKTGKQYDQDYYFHVELDDQGRIAYIREYFNMMPILEVLRPAVEEWQRAQAAAQAG